MKMRPTIVILVILALFAGGCYDRKLQEEKSATELMADGLKKFEDRDYLSAITAYRRVTEWYPFSEHVPVAELQIAEAYYKLRQYSQAAVTYEQFANLHPRHPSTPYALYQVGRCFFDQIHAIDRDQGNARKALTALNRFVDRYPDSEYTDPARAHAKDCQRYLAANELLVAKYYYKNKNYKAALNRFRGIVEDYPDIGVQHVALQYLAKCKALVEAEASTTGRPAGDFE
jgi:outer membrane protein assembly factor BamD